MDRLWLGIFIGVFIWGAIATGLRIIHNEFKLPIPHVIMIPQKAAKLLPGEAKHSPDELEKVHMVAAPAKPATEWEKIKDWISIAANAMTIIAPLFSGAMAITVYRRQRMLVAVQGKERPVKLRSKRNKGLSASR